MDPQRKSLTLDARKPRAIDDLRISMSGMMFSKFTAVALTTLVTLLPIGCAKSQQPLEASHTSLLRTEEHHDPAIFTVDDTPDTTLVAFAEFELLELEGHLEDELWGHFEGRAVNIVPRNAGRLLEIVGMEDLDGDGWMDLVVGEAAEEKCCPRQFTVISYRGNGKYHESKPQGAALHLPSLSMHQGKPVLTIENRQLDPYQSYATEEIFTLEAGELKAIAANHPTERIALSEMRIGAFDSLSPKATLELAFDLDGDGKTDRVVGRLWPNYHRILWSVTFGNGIVMEDGMPFQRLGVLPTKTEGVHDLVVDADRVLIWKPKSKRYDTD